MTDNERQKKIMELAVALCGRDKTAVLTLFTQCIQGILISSIDDPATGLRAVAAHFNQAAAKLDVNNMRVS